MQLPVTRELPALLSALASAGAAVLIAPPGSGKTTAVPLPLCRTVSGRVLLVQPRRVAARAAARFLAQQHGTAPGQAVGWQVRFERVAGPKTQLLVVTQGILLRLLQADPFLEGVSAVLLDEFHERSLEGDLALSLLAQVRRDARPDLQLLVMSATLDPAPVSAFLAAPDPAPILRAEGRSYPITLHYHERPDARPIHERVAEAAAQALAEAQGHVLCFLPGVAEIRRTAALLAERGLPSLPLYGDLPAAEQDAALRPGPTPTIVLATNVAETSLTLDGVRSVVDSGLVRVQRRDPASGLDRLSLEAISQASADQRAGRAGRQAPGQAYRLWSSREQLGKPAATDAEVHRVDLSGTALQLLAWGERDLHAFPWYEAPQPHALQDALALLERLGATEGGALSARGRTLAQLPAQPRLARLLEASHAAGYAQEGAELAALLAERHSLRPEGGPTSDSDVLDLRDRLASAPAHQPGLYALRRAAAQLAKQSHEAFGPSPRPTQPRDEALRRALLSAFPDRLAKRRQPGEPRLRLDGGRGAVLHRSSAVRNAELMLCLDVDDAGAEATVRLASAVDAAWLSPRTERHVRYDASKDRVVGESWRVVGEDLVLEVHTAQADPMLAADALVEAALRYPDRCKPGAEALLARLAFVQQHSVNDAWPSPEGLYEQALQLASHGARSLAELQAALPEALRQALGWREAQRLDELAPTALRVPSGRTHALSYPLGAAPVLAVKLQELFGCPTTPTLCGVRLTLHLLAPNGRPQQVTDDLAGFWAGSYQDVRKDLRARYPRHPWPEDPLNAPPTARTKPRGT